MQQAGYGILFILGISVFGGMLGGWIFQRLRIPQVVGYIVIGLIIGESGFKIVQSTDITRLAPLNFFALGIIGFLVGGELKMESFRKYIGSYLAILFGEGLGAFLLVSIPSALVFYAVSHSVSLAAAGGIVLGAISSATDPASTIDVLWEYRAKGPLTSAITAIVALDDALAMLLYGIGTGIAQMLTGAGGSLPHELAVIGKEVFGAVLLGLIFALLLMYLLRRFHQPEKALAVGIGLILLLISITLAENMDVILAAMTVGFVVANWAPRRSEALFKILREFSTPIYVLFFVLVGARLSVGHLHGWLFAIVAIYVIGRSVGKIAGAYIAARAYGSDAVVRRYLGLGIFPQGGVAIGLSIMASERVGNIAITGSLTLGEAIIFSVTATTLIVQLIGPPLVKLAVKLAGETGRNITEDDVIASWSVADVMDRNIFPIQEEMPVGNIMRVFSENRFLVYPVVDLDGKLIGTLSLVNLKEVLTKQEAWSWLVASDLVEHGKNITTPGKPLRDVLDTMIQTGTDQMVVADSNGNNRLLGMLDQKDVRKQIQEELIRRQTPSAT